MKSETPVLSLPKFKYYSRIHRSMTGGLSQLQHRVVVSARQATWLVGLYDNPMEELTLSLSQESMNSAAGLLRLCHWHAVTVSRSITTRLAPSKHIFAGRNESQNVSNYLQNLK